MVRRLATLLILAAAIVPATAHAGHDHEERLPPHLPGQHDAESDGVRITEGFLPDRIEFLAVDRAPAHDAGGADAVRATPTGRPDPAATLRRHRPIDGRSACSAATAYDQFESRFSPFAVTMRGGGGGDELYAGPTADELEGGPGGDYLDGWSGNDILRGQGGRDTLRPSIGADLIEGGAQFDRVDYGDRATGVTVTLGSGADDGEAGEGDDVRADVEDATGGTGNDRLIGSAGSNELSGGAGADELVGGGGFDVLAGGPGDDRVVAQDGSADQVTCAEGIDSALVDVFDALSECESVDASNALQPDRDADGLLAPIDCDDTRADVRPARATSRTTAWTRTAPAPTRPIPTATATASSGRRTATTRGRA